MSAGVQATNAEVTFEDVSKTFGPVIAVNKLNLRVSQGEFLVLLGPSGCGKTTSLRMLAGLERISSGTIRIGGTVANELPPRSRNVAMVFQSYALYPHLSVFDNLAYPLRIRATCEIAVFRNLSAILAETCCATYFDVHEYTGRAVGATPEWAAHVARMQRDQSSSCRRSASIDSVDT